VGDLRGVRSRLSQAAVRVRLGSGQVVGDVPILARVGRRGRAGDVGDRCDVIPIDAVANPKQERRRQEGQSRRGGSGGGHSCNEVHVNSQYGPCCTVSQ
jgi:hypothetical protein